MMLSCSLFVTFTRNMHLSKIQLDVQLPLLKCLVEGSKVDEVCVGEVVCVLGNLSAVEKIAFSGVLAVMKLLLVMLETNTTSEHSFSPLRCTKTSLRTTMTQQHLNHLMVLYIHTTSTDDLDLMNVAREFAARREGRLRVFEDCR